MRGIDILSNQGSQGDWTIEFHMPSHTAENLFFHVENIGHYRCSPNYYLKREKYYSFLILCTISGQGELEYRGHKYVLEPNKIAFFNTYEPHIYHPAGKDKEWEFYWLHFNGKQAQAYLETILDKGNPVLSVKDNMLYQNAIAEIFESTSQKNLQFEISASTYITKMLNHLLIAANEQTKTDKRYSSAVENAIDYIKCHYAQEVHIPNVADYVHLSLSHFIRTFKNWTDCSPYEYLIRYRITVAKMHLTHSEISIGQIAHDVGFSSINNFITTFKKQEGITPYQYKKKYTGSHTLPADEPEKES